MSSLSETMKNQGVLLLGWRWSVSERYKKDDDEKKEMLYDALIDEGKNTLWYHDTHEK